MFWQRKASKKSDKTQQVARDRAAAAPISDAPADDEYDFMANNAKTATPKLVINDVAAPRYVSRAQDGLLGGTSPDRASYVEPHHPNAGSEHRRGGDYDPTKKPAPNASQKPASPSDVRLPDGATDTSDTSALEGAALSAVPKFDIAALAPSSPNMQSRATSPSLFTRLIANRIWSPLSMRGKLMLTAALILVLVLIFMMLFGERLPACDSLPSWNQNNCVR